MVSSKAKTNGLDDKFQRSMFAGNAPRRDCAIMRAARVCGRAVECTGLENRRGETHREFESHRTRQAPFQSLRKSPTSVERAMVSA